MLNNVSKWNSDSGLKHITAQEAYKETPWTVSSYENKYFCETCGQSVALYLYNNTPTFRHSNNSTECEDKITEYNSRFNDKTNPLGISLPLRIIFNTNSIEIQIGFLPLQSTVLDKLQKEDFMFNIKNANDTVLKQYNCERLSENYVTYLSVGNNISRYYVIDYKSDMLQARIWPTIVDGIVPTGTLFDSRSGKRLPRNAEIVVNKDYWLLTEDISIANNDFIIADEQHYQNWHLYLIKTKQFSQQAAKWLLKYGVRLVDKPAKIIPIWPIVNRSSHCLTFSAENLLFYKTAGIINTYPVKKQYTENEGLFCINNQQREQFISVSRFVDDDKKNVIKYTFIRYMKPIPYNIEPTKSVIIHNINNELIYSGEHNELPTNGKIYIESSFAGFIKQEQNNNEIKRIKIKANTTIPLDVKFGQTIKIFYGLDCMAEISFVKPAIIQSNDESLFMKLLNCSGEMLPIRHSLGALANDLVNMPKTQQWLLQQIRKKIISKNALKLLKKRFGKM